MARNVGAGGSNQRASAARARLLSEGERASTLRRPKWCVDAQRVVLCEGTSAFKMEGCSHSRLVVLGTRRLAGRIETLVSLGAEDLDAQLRGKAVRVVVS